MLFEFTIKRQKRKTMALHVLDDASVEVRVPKWLAKREIDRFVKERSDWVVQQQQKRQQRLAAKPRFTQSERHPYLGQSLPLNIQAAGRNSVTVTDAAINLWAREPEDPQFIQSLLKEGYRAHAKKLFAERLQHFFSIMTLSCPKPELKVRVMKRRWGSTSNKKSASKSTITLNLELMKYPLDCIDYVVVHELCHLLEMNHSPQFYSHIAKVIPDWRKHELLLEQLALDH
jgi:predicted metal-dependent hydrolase